jgi:hypothetical protein
LSPDFSISLHISMSLVLVMSPSYCDIARGYNIARISLFSPAVTISLGC